MLIHSAVITGSVQFNNTDVSGITNVSSFATTASVDALVVKTGSYASTSSVNELQSKTGSYTSTSSFDAYSSSINTFTSSATTRLNTIESVTGSYASTSSVNNLQSVTGSYASTGSNQFNGNQSISGSITSNGTITAQTLVVQTVTSSVEFVTGSTRNGSLSSNTHQFTGSVLMSGSLNIGSSVTSDDLILTAGTLFGTGNTGFSNRLSDTTLYLQMPATGFNITDNALNTKFILSSTGAATFSSSVTTSGGGFIANMSTTNTPALTINRSNTASNGIIKFQTGASDTWILGNRNTSDETFRLYSYSAGADVLTVTSAGNVGIGTTSPQANLHVLDVLKISNSAQSQGNLILGDGGSTSFNVGIGRWNGANNTAGAGGLGYFAQGATNSGGHFFYTGDAVAGSTTERMRITSGGSINLGSTTNYVNVGNDTGGVYMETVGSEDGRRVIRIQTGNSSFSNYSSVSIDGANQLVKISTSNTERLRITSTGVLVQNGVGRVCFAGRTSGNSAFAVTVNCSSESSMKITCLFNHYGLFNSYGCARMSFVSIGPSSDEANISNVASGNGGSWSFARINSTSVSINKNAGSYGGDGYYFIEVVGANLT